MKLENQVDFLFHDWEVNFRRRYRRVQIGTERSVLAPIPSTKCIIIIHTCRPVDNTFSSVCPCDCLLLHVYKVTYQEPFVGNTFVIPHQVFCVS